MNRRLAVTFYMTPWLVASVITLVFLFSQTELPCEVGIAPDRSKLEQEQCDKCGFRLVGYQVGQIFTAISAPLTGAAYCASWYDSWRVGVHSSFKGH